MVLPTQKIIYAVLAISLLLTEVFIALKIPATSFIRHSLGDMLVVILIYFAIKTFFDVDSKKLAIATCLFAFLIELSQYFQILNHLNITNKFFRIVLGTSFSVGDLLMYFIGSIIAYLIDSRIIKNRP
jgi:hypothetical protein